jgi:hypothetical protein
MNRKEIIENIKTAKKLLYDAYFQLYTLSFEQTGQVDVQKATERGFIQLFDERDMFHFETPETWGALKAEYSSLDNFEFNLNDCLIDREE